MFRRLVAPLMTLAAVAALVIVLSPTGATGAERPTDSSRRDMYVFNRTGAVTSPVNGNVQVYGGDVTISDIVRGDLLVVGGRVVFAGSGRIEGSVIHAGSTIENGEGRITGRTYPLASLEGAAASMTKSAIVASLLLVWLITAVAVTLMSGREIRASSVEVRASSLYCFVLGLVGITSFVLTAIAFSYLVPYVIGIPLLAALGVFAIVTKIYGMIAVFHAVGTIVARSRSRHELESRRWLRGDMAMVVIGVVLLGAVRLIPVVGTIAWGVASVFGVGVALGTRFGRREPWFLELRSATA